MVTFDRIMRLLFDAEAGAGAGAPAEGEAQAPNFAELSAKDYRAAREQGDAPPAEEPAATKGDEGDEGREQPDPASEAGKALAGKKRTLQSRIDELTARNGQTQRERDAIAAEAAELRAKLARLEQGGKPEGDKPKAEDGRPVAPKLSDFASWDEYEAAREEYEDKLTDWKIEQRERNYQATAQQRAILQRNAEVEQAIKGKYPDFDAKIAEFAEAGHVFHPVVQEFIRAHPDGADLAYALVSDPAENARIAALGHPGVIAFELGKVLAKIGGAPARVSAAPAPVRAAKGPAPAAVTPTIEAAATKGSMRDYRRLRESR